jgi:type I restriction enzyme S subunit
LNSFCFGFRFNDTKMLLPEFAGYLLRGPIVRRCLGRMAQGYTRYNLSQSAVLALNVAVPPLPEQKRIARFLGVLDDELLLLARELKADRKERKALMRSLMQF